MTCMQKIIATHFTTQQAKDMKEKYNPQFICNNKRYFEPRCTLKMSFVIFLFAPHHVASFGLCSQFHLPC